MKRPRHNQVELAQRIVDMVRETGLDVGARLPEQWIADRFSVSRTPVRAALRLLAGQGIVENAPGEGYRLAAPPGNLAGGTAPLPDAPEEALYKAILRDRAARRLDGGITISALMRRYSATRQTVLKSLQRLSEEQLVERAPGQSWLFRPSLDGHDAMAESYRFRLLLEPEALVQPGFVLDGAHLAILRKEMEAVLAMPEPDFDVRAFYRTDFEFHEALARGCGNRFVADTLLHHHRLRRLPNAVVQANVFRLKQATREHLSIMDHLEAGRHEAAADLMRVHLRLAANQRPAVASRGAPPARRFAPAPRG